MIVNDSKGSLGCFSFAGRTSAEYYKVLLDSNQQYTNKKTQKNEKQKEDNYIDPEIDDIFNIDDTLNKANNETIVQSPIKAANPIKDYYKFYAQHRHPERKTKKKEYPSCTQYNPKNDFIFKKLISGPKWSSQTPKTFFIKTDDTHYYLNHEEITANKVGKTLIDMSKMTMRGEFTCNSHDVRIKNIKALTKSNSTTTFSPNKTRKDSKSNQNTISSNKENPIKLRSSISLSNMKSSPIKKSSNTNKIISPNVYNEKKKTPLKNKKELNISTSSDDSYEEYRYLYQKQFKNRSLSTQNKKKQPFIKAPDFKRVITRKQLDKLNDKKSLIPFSLPNFKLVRERPVMMVSYKFNNHKCKKKRTLTTMDSSPYLHPYKYIEKINNHKGISSPNFKLMKPRPSSNHPLPLFMNKIYNRLAGYEITDLSLKLNNYSNGFFQEQPSTFFPKKTFNKIINLNLLNSNHLLSNLNWQSMKEKNKTSKSMKFYSKNIYDYFFLLDKNYDDLMKEAMLTKFDNVTLKANTKQNKLDLKEIESFLMNYDIKTNDDNDVNDE